MTHEQSPVLVVDDCADSRDLLSVMLGILGCPVVVARDGPEGLALLRMRRPWLILLDLMMPGMDGEAFRQHQLAEPGARDIPVVVVSGHYFAQAVATRMGADACLMKPIDLSQLAAIVEKLKVERLSGT